MEALKKVVIYGFCVICAIETIQCSKVAEPNYPELQESGELSNATGCRPCKTICGGDKLKNKCWCECHEYDPEHSGNEKKCLVLKAQLKQLEQFVTLNLKEQLNSIGHGNLLAGEEQFHKFSRSFLYALVVLSHNEHQNHQTPNIHTDLANGTNSSNEAFFEHNDSKSWNYRWCTKNIPWFKNLTENISDNFHPHILQPMFDENLKDQFFGEISSTGFSGFENHNGSIYFFEGFIFLLSLLENRTEMKNWKYFNESNLKSSPENEEKWFNSFCALLSHINGSWDGTSFKHDNINVTEKSPKMGSKNHSNISDVLRLYRKTCEQYSNISNRKFNALRIHLQHFQNISEENFEALVSSTPWTNFSHSDFYSGFWSFLSNKTNGQNQVNNTHMYLAAQAMYNLYWLQKNWGSSQFNRSNAWQVYWNTSEYKNGNFSVSANVSWYKKSQFCSHVLWEHVLNTNHHYDYKNHQDFDNLKVGTSCNPWVYLLKAGLHKTQPNQKNFVGKILKIMWELHGASYNLTRTDWNYKNKSLSNILNGSKFTPEKDDLKIDHQQYLLSLFQIINSENLSFLGESVKDTAENIKEEKDGHKSTRKANFSDYETTIKKLNITSLIYKLNLYWERQNNKTCYSSGQRDAIINQLMKDIDSCRTNKTFHQTSNFNQNYSTPRPEFPFPTPFTKPSSEQTEFLVPEYIASGKDNDKGFRLDEVLPHNSVFVVTYIPSPQIGVFEYQVSSSGGDDVVEYHDYDADNNEDDDHDKDDKKGENEKELQPKQQEFPTKFEQLCSEGWICVETGTLIKPSYKLRFHINDDNKMGIVPLTLKEENENSITLNFIVAAGVERLSDANIPFDNLPAWWKEFTMVRSGQGLEIDRNLGSEIDMVETMKKMENNQHIFDADNLKFLIREQNPGLQAFWELLRKSLQKAIYDVLISRDILKTFSVEYKFADGKQWTKVKNGKSFVVSGDGNLKFTPKKKTDPARYKFQIKKSEDITWSQFYIEIKPDPEAPKLKVPKGFSLDPVPFDIELNFGMNVSSLAKVLLKENEKTDNISLFVKPLNSHLGQWQFQWQGKWTNLTELITTDKSSIEKSSRIFLSPSGRIRFQPVHSQLFWKRSQAWSSTRITLWIWDADMAKSDEAKLEYEELLHQYNSHGYVNVMYCTPESQDCDDITERHSDLISLDSVTMVIEREGCDGGKSSLQVTDLCGVCGGDGSSCVDCNGDPYGGAIIDECSICSGGLTNITPNANVDCASGCFGNNYMDECGFCQNRLKPYVDMRDCSGKCYGKAKVNKCGHCVSEYVFPPLEALEDICGVCGGDNTSCLGCDGVPGNGKVLDDCGSCQHPKDKNFNQGCLSNLRILNLFHIINKTSPSLELIFYGHFLSFTSSNCWIQLVNGSNFPVSERLINLGLSDIFSSFTDLADIKSAKKYLKEIRDLPPSTDFLYFHMDSIFVHEQPTLWNAHCLLYKNESDTQIISSNGSTILIQPSNWPVLDHVIPTHIPIGSGPTDLMITGDMFLEEFPLTCILIAKSKNWRQFSAKYVNQTMISCEIPSVNKSMQLHLSVLYRPEAVNINANYIKKSTNFLSITFYAPSPTIISAKLNFKLGLISIKFNQLIKLRQGKGYDCATVFKSRPAGVLGARPSCFEKKNGVIVKPDPNALLHTNASELLRTGFSLAMKRGSVIGRRSDQYFDIFPATTFEVELPDIVEPVSVSIRGQASFGLCQNVYFAFVTNGVVENITWKVRGNDRGFVTMFQKHLENIIKSGRVYLGKVPANLTMIQNFTISVQATNILGMKSGWFNYSFQLLSDVEQLQVEILGDDKQRIRSTQNLKLKASVLFNFPHCDEFSSRENKELPSAARLVYIWEGEDLATSRTLILDEFKDEDENWKRVLFIPSGNLIAGIEYQFIVTVILLSGDTMLGQSSDDVTVIIESSDLVAIVTDQFADGLVNVSEQLILNGLQSYDPDKSKTEITYKWSCEDMRGTPCVVKSNFSQDSVDIRADAVFPKYELTPGYIVIPAALFPTDIMYNFTLTISAGGRSASASTYVKVKSLPPSQPRIIFTSKQGQVVSIKRINRFKAYAKSDAAFVGTVHWTSLEDEEFSKLDLDKNLSSPVTSEITVPSSSRFPVPLVIKPDSLQPASKYKIQLTLTSLSDDVILSEAAFTFSTPSLPQGGILQVTPQSGIAMSTTFTLQTSSWFDPTSDSDKTSFQYKFGYYKTMKGVLKFTTLQSFTEHSVATVLLPPGEHENTTLHLVVFAKHSDDKNQMRNMAFAEVIVHPRLEYDDKAINDTLDTITEAILSGDHSKASATISTLTDAFEDRNQSKEEIKEVVDAFALSILDILPRTKSEADELLEQANSVASRVNLVSSSIKHFSQIPGNIIDAQYQGEKILPRKRRNTDATPTERSEIPPEVVSEILSLYDAVLSGGHPDDLDYHTARTNFARDLKSIKSSLCRSVAYMEPTLKIETPDSKILVQKKTKVANFFADLKLQVYFSEEVTNVFNSWPCLESNQCNGACIAIGGFTHNIKTWYNTEEIHRVSDIVSLSILNPESGAETSDLLSSNGSFSVTLSFNSLKMESFNRASHSYECRRWDTVMWRKEPCHVIATTADFNGAVVGVSCQCSETQGYFAVFAIALPTTTQSTETTKYVTTDDLGSCKEPKELASVCDTPCVLSCDDLTPNPPCSEECVPKRSCVCPHGLVADEFGDCISADECNEGPIAPPDPYNPRQWVMTLVWSLVGIFLALLVLVPAAIVISSRYNKRTPVISLQRNVKNEYRHNDAFRHARAPPLEPVYDNLPPFHDFPPAYCPPGCSRDGKADV